MTRRNAPLSLPPRRVTGTRTVVLSAADHFGGPLFENVTIYQAEDYDWKGRPVQSDADRTKWPLAFTMANVARLGGDSEATYVDDASPLKFGADAAVTSLPRCLIWWVASRGDFIGNTGDPEDDVGEQVRLAVEAALGPQLLAARIFAGEMQGAVADGALPAGCPCTEVAQAFQELFYDSFGDTFYLHELVGVAVPEPSRWIGGELLFVRIELAQNATGLHVVTQAQGAGETGGITYTIKVLSFDDVLNAEAIALGAYVQSDLWDRVKYVLLHVTVTGLVSDPVEGPGVGASMEAQNNARSLANAGALVSAGTPNGELQTMSDPTAVQIGERVVNLARDFFGLI